MQPPSVRPLSFDKVLHCLSTGRPRRVNAWELLRSMMREGLSDIEAGNLLDFVDVRFDSQEVQIGGRCCPCSGCWTSGEIHWPTPPLFIRLIE